MATSQSMFNLTNEEVIMKNFLLFIFLCFILSLTLMSCKRTASNEVAGDLKDVNLTALNGIPTEYGSLVAITTQADFPGWAQLWFEDDSKTIRIVRIGTTSNRINEKVTIIPRN